MKILILGAKGNLGCQLQKVFKNNDVTPWDVEDIDITDKELIDKKIKDLKPNVVVNAAAYNAVDLCEETDEEFELAKKINGLAPGYLAEACCDIGAVLVHYSSDYVFKGDALSEYGEKDDPEPINNYGRSKLLGEKNIISFSGKKLKYYIIRTSKLFGPRGASEIAKPSFFDIMLELSKTKKEIDVVDDERSCFTYTPDLALWTKKLLDSDSGYGIYHFINEGACTWYQAAVELFAMTKTEIKINRVAAGHFSRSAQRPQNSALINTKFEKMRNYKEALKEYFNENKK